MVSLVVLKEHDKYDLFPWRASTGERQKSYVSGTWNWKYLREKTSKLQGSFCPKSSFIEFFMILKFFLSDSFSFVSGKRDLKSNPFEEGGNDVPRSEHRPVWIMDTTQGGDLVNQLNQTEVLQSDHAELTDHVIPSVHSVHTNHVFPLDRADQTVSTIPSDHPTLPHVLCTISTHRRLYWSSVWNHDLKMELIDPYHFFPNQFNIKSPFRAYRVFRRLYCCPCLHVRPFDGFLSSIFH